MRSLVIKKYSDIALMRKFDLNIEKILENWETHHAIREVISNAIDEQLLTGSAPIDIYKRDNDWFIRDYGSGLQYFHLTQNENQQKKKNTSVIGQYGIGLKDALATFDKKGIKVIARSKHATISTAKSAKEGFSDIETLHAIIEPSHDETFNGSEFEISGITDKDMEEAKKMFLIFTSEKIIASTKKGEVIEKNGKVANIYVNGLKVAEEENFLFSYNITEKNSKIRGALNRERTNVGRTAYTDSVQKILLTVKSENVTKTLASDLQNENTHDELKWTDVLIHAIKILNSTGKYLFVTVQDVEFHRDTLDDAKDDDYEFVYITQPIKAKIRDIKDYNGNPINLISTYIHLYNDSFEFEFIELKDLNEKELKIYKLTPDIIKLYGGQPNAVKDIRISSIMRKDHDQTVGCWDAATGTIILSRTTLESVADYAGTLIHELIHAKTGERDISREFENSLTEVIGHLCERALLGNI